MQSFWLDNRILHENALVVTDTKETRSEVEVEQPNYNHITMEVGDGIEERLHNTHDNGVQELPGREKKERTG